MEGLRIEMGSLIEESALAPYSEAKADIRSRLSNWIQ